MCVCGGGGGGGAGGEGGLKHFYSQPTTLGPGASHNTEIHKKSVRIKAPNSVNASKRKHKNQINHYNKQDEYSWLILLYARVNENQ